MTALIIEELSSPAGSVTAATFNGALVGLTFSDHWERFEADVAKRCGAIEIRVGASGLAGSWKRYLGGDMDAFAGVEIDAGGTDFQRRVWTALRTIPPGSTWSYADLATAVGQPGASRAVGSANGANPIWIAVPCHRVIKADGSLGGYGGGIARKEWLLNHEGAWAG